MWHGMLTYHKAKQQWDKEKENLQQQLADLTQDKAKSEAQKDARIDDLARQLQHYANEHAIYTIERTKLGQEYAGVYKLQQENKTLKDDLAQARSLLVRLMAQTQEQKQAVSHTRCQNQIQQLKEALSSHKAAIAAVYGEDILESQQTLPQDAGPEAPFNPSWETQCPVNPVTTRHIVTNDNITNEVIYAP